MVGYEGFIPENTAPAGAKRIGIYKNGDRVGFARLGSLRADKGKRLYSFGAVSDIHLDESNTIYPTSVPDCQKAFRYYNDHPDIDFLCICGDLTEKGRLEELTFYQSVVDTYIPDKPVHVAAGNHEEYLYNSSDYYEQTVGHPLYYAFEYKGDVFIMCGVMSSHEDRLFEAGELDWLEGVLEANKNKRCFLFMHIPTAEGSGDPLNAYSGTQLASHADSVRFKGLLTHYKNVIHFHGHTHFKFELQERSDMANYDKLFGTHSVHIPSLTVTRGLSDSNGLTSAVELSQGYIVDVYEGGIHLRGRDFVHDRDSAVASYWLDTATQPVA